MEVANLMQTNAGDELHDPANWVGCRSCGATCPRDSETCFDCGGVL